MIKAIIFDVDGVLIDSFEVNLRFFQKLLAEVGYPQPTRKDFTKAFHLNMKEAIKILSGLHDKDEIEKIWELGKSGKIKAEIDLLTMPPGAEDVIKMLNKKYLLGIVTSRMHVFSSPHLKKLEKYFRNVVSYTDTKNHKPHPEPLLLAAKRLGLSPSECLYIGDAKTDIEAAISAGMKIILYAQEGIEGADAVTDSFEKLPEIIEKL